MNNDKSTFTNQGHIIKHTLLFVFLCLFAVLPQANAKNADLTIAFGSCAKERQAQPIWLDIAKHKPDVFLFIGDNNYADVQEINGELVYGPVTDPKRFAQAYNAVNAIETFAQFRKQVPIMLGTWDDHDYGANDAGKEFPLKAQSQAAFVDFFEFEPNHPIHQQAGIYHSKIIEDNGKKIQIIMLDTRYHRDLLTKNPLGRPKNKGPYIPSLNQQASMLGSEQWAWLKSELQQFADIRIIVSSVQVVAYEHSWEGWGMMPTQRDALYALIGETKANGVVFLSGDRHLMEISKDTGQLGHSVPYPMWDFTSSGINQDYSQVNEPNSFRIGNVVRDNNYGLVNVSWHEKDIMKTTIEFVAHGLNQKRYERVSLVLGDLQIQ
ncbi:MAG: alkaline phosphatase D [Kangiellaceae bacterium]|jgi:alkaline phosphatase D